MKKTPSKKLSLNIETIRNLTSNELTRVGGGSHISIVTNPGTTVMTIGSGTSVISHNPSGGLPSGGIVGH